MSVTEEIKSRLDIVSYIQQYAPLKKAGRYHKACCPFHTEKTPSFVVNPTTQSWRCFGACAEGGDIFSFAQKYHNWTFREALQELGKQAGVEVRKQSPAERQKNERLDQLRGLLQAAADIYLNNLTKGESDGVQKVLSYVKEKRGLTTETIEQFAIGYAPPGWRNMLDELLLLGYEESDIIETGMAVKNEDSGRVYDRFRNRLMIAIRDHRGRVIGFGARALDPDDNPKYLNSPQTPLFDKSRVLFGLDLAKAAIRDSETVVIVEGYMDVIQAHQAGFTNVVAQMGTAMTESQLRLVTPRFAQKIILALDADAAGQNATRRSLETARQTLTADYAGRLSVDIRVLQIPDAKDPDDLIRETPDKWQDLVNRALPVADYVINMETASLPQGLSVRDIPLQEREAIAKKILPLLVASESNTMIQANVQKLSSRLRIRDQDLMALAKVYISSRPEKQGSKTISRALPPQKTAAESDGPPPLDYDEFAPPYDLDDDIDYSPEALGAVTATSQQRQPTSGIDNGFEAYCLRILCLSPKYYYQINRRLRELAAGDELLLQSALCDLGAADFSRSDYCRIMEVFAAAINQHEIDIVDFLSDSLDPALKAELDILLVEESDTIHRRVNRRYPGDFNAVWRKFEKHTKPGIDLAAEALEKALSLRLQRLKRELDELTFIQLEAQQDNDYYAAIEIGRQVNISNRAIDYLDLEIDQSLKNFV